MLEEQALGGRAHLVGGERRVLVGGLGGGELDAALALGGLVRGRGAVAPPRSAPGGLHLGAAIRVTNR